MRVHIEKLNVYTDDRGWLVEVLKKEQLKKKEFGQFFVSTAHPNVVKGNHYHTHKTEWFCVIKGKGKLCLQDVKTLEKMEVFMGDENMFTVKILPNVAHGIKNIGNDMMYLLVYADEVFDPKDPDTFNKKVI